jgi:hypothetical protein
MKFCTNVYQAAAKAASLGGTTLGNLMGVKDEPDLGEGVLSVILHDRR